MTAFNEIEMKLLKLALDSAAHPGEVRNAAVKLVESLRRRHASVEMLHTSRPGSLTLATARRRVMPFGKHRGRQLQAIEPSYLKWALRECSCLSLGLREAICAVLEAALGADN